MSFEKTYKMNFCEWLWSERRVHPFILNLLKESDLDPTMPDANMPFELVERLNEADVDDLEGSDLEPALKGLVDEYHAEAANFCGLLDIKTTVKCVGARREDVFTAVRLWVDHWSKRIESYAEAALYESDSRLCETELDDGAPHEDIATHAIVFKLMDFDGWGIRHWLIDTGEESAEKAVLAVLDEFVDASPETRAPSMGHLVNDLGWLDGCLNVTTLTIDPPASLSCYGQIDLETGECSWPLTECEIAKLRRGKAKAGHL